ncbi:hypothetical protein [Nitratifractor sp.]|uniref:hypothetical protein n=1 Tax=Nitratifractor sp. TaxID=2268144 RepID=UPI0025E470D0|nr:hypothetical protein [Nitratifractor sp.]
MKKFWIYSIVAAAMLCSGASNAGGDNGYVGDTTSGYKTGGFFGLSGSYVFSLQSSIIKTNNGFLDDSYDGDGGSFGVHLGGQEGQWRATLSYEYFDNDDQNYDLFLAQIDYLFIPDAGMFQPYIGIDGGYLNYETTGDNTGGFTYGGALGINFSISQHLDVDLGVRYLFASQDEVDHLGTVNIGFNYFY